MNRRRPRLPPEATAQVAAVTDGAVRIGPIIELPALVRELGQDPDALAAAAGIDPRLLEDPENNISFHALGQLLDQCVARTGCPHFGLLLGRRSGLECLGLVGMLAQCSPDLGTALRNIVLYLHLHDRGAIPTLSVADGRAHLGYAIYQPGVKATAQIYDGAVAIANNLLQALAGPSWQPLEVLFAHARPEDVEPYRRTFRAPLRFDAEQSGIVFPAACLDRPLAGADAALWQTLKDRISAVEAMGGGDIVVQVQRVACHLLLSGRPALDAVAEVFAVHPRTLNRHLQARGTSFQRLLDGLRRELARQLLRDTDLPVVHIAETLGYGDAPAFTRAFRRWSQSSPTLWRSMQRRG